jgi:hypothetical protein
LAGQKSARDKFNGSIEDMVLEPGIGSKYEAINRERRWLAGKSRLNCNEKMRIGSSDRHK